MRYRQKKPNPSPRNNASKHRGYSLADYVLAFGIGALAAQLIPTIGGYISIALAVASLSAGIYFLYFDDKLHDRKTWISALGMIIAAIALFIEVLMKLSLQH